MLNKDWQHFNFVRLQDLKFSFKKYNKKCWGFFFFFLLTLQNNKIKKQSVDQCCILGEIKGLFMAHISSTQPPLKLTKSITRNNKFTHLGQTQPLCADPRSALFALVSHLNIHEVISSDGRLLPWRQIGL